MDSRLNVNIENLEVVDFFDLMREEIKKEYSCENSQLLDFNPSNEHIEKSEYKGKICYIKVKNN